MDIEYLRKEIDLIDDELINLLDKRFEKTDQIGVLKQKTNKTILDNKRELEIIKKIKDSSKNEEVITLIYNFIMDESKKRQK